MPELWTSVLQIQTDISTQKCEDGDITEKRFNIVKELGQFVFYKHTVSPKEFRF